MQEGERAVCTRMECLLALAVERAGALLECYMGWRLMQGVGWRVAQGFVGIG